MICEPAMQATLFQIHIFKRCWNIFLQKESQVGNPSYTSFTNRKFSLFENNAENSQSYMFVWWFFFFLESHRRELSRKELEHMSRNSSSQLSSQWQGYPYNCNLYFYKTPKENQRVSFSTLSESTSSKQLSKL